MSTAQLTSALRPDHDGSPVPIGDAGSEFAGSRGGELALRFGGVVRRYGRRLALDHLDLEVRTGEMVALLGPNGAGKSTAISLLLGLLRPHEGTVEVLGTTARHAVAQGSVGAMLQTGSGSGLPPGVKVSEALALVRRLYRKPASFEATVERAGIGPLLGNRTSALSGGEAQRVRFALAIAGDPKLVFLDEPTVAMDVDGRRTFWRMMRQFGEEGRTIVFATHHLEEADQTADRVVVINHGRVVADGPGATLKAAVAARHVRFVVSDPDPDRYDRLEGVTDVEVGGAGVTLISLDADATTRDLVRSGIPFKNLEVTGACLEDAFVALTGRSCHDERGRAR
ncbi:MAG: ABC transporter ATP-binding protein [Acidimicrobiales bacterium]